MEGRKVLFWRIVLKEEDNFRGLLHDLKLLYGFVEAFSGSFAILAHIWSSSYHNDAERRQYTVQGVIERTSRSPWIIVAQMVWSCEHGFAVFSNIPAVIGSNTNANDSKL